MGCNFPKERWQPTEEYAAKQELIGKPLPRVIVKSTGALEPMWWIEANINQPKSRGFRREDCKVEFTRCGKCLGCRMDKAREWAIRQTAEASLYPEGSNWFCTFTLNKENMTFNPKGVMTLERDRIKKLDNSIRKKAERAGFVGIRKYGCGEYGSKNGRPHYHINFFNMPIQEMGWHLKRIKTTGQGYVLYQCQELDDIWHRGYVTIGKFTAESAGYVARYVTKKIKDQADDYYYESVGLVAPYQLAYSKPGLGHDYFISHMEEIYKSDKIILPKFPGVKPCSYSDDLLKDIHVDQWYDIKQDRREKALTAEISRQQREKISIVDSKLRQEEKLLRTLKYELPRNIE